LKLYLIGVVSPSQLSFCLHCNKAESCVLTSWSGLQTDSSSKHGNTFQSITVKLVAIKKLETFIFLITH